MVYLYTCYYVKNKNEVSTYAKVWLNLKHILVTYFKQIYYVTALKENAQKRHTLDII